MKRSQGSQSNGGEQKNNQQRQKEGGMAQPEAAAKADVDRLRDETVDELEELRAEKEELRNEIEALRADNEELREAVQEFREVFATLDVTLATIVEDSGAWSSPEYDRDNPINEAADDEKLEEIEDHIGG
jgi:predicted nuclease with TOPRIM domain